jgi:hypothetical protein
MSWCADAPYDALKRSNPALSTAPEGMVAFPSEFADPGLDVDELSLTGATDGQKVEVSTVTDMS